MRPGRDSSVDSDAERGYVFRKQRLRRFRYVYYALQTSPRAFIVTARAAPASETRRLTRFAIASRSRLLLCPPSSLLLSELNHLDLVARTRLRLLCANCIHS